MKKVLKERINYLISKDGTKRLKDTIAYLLGLDKITDNTYHMYDKHCHLSNVDLHYIVSISDTGGIVQESEGYWTKEYAITSILATKSELQPQSEK